MQPNDHEGKRAREARGLLALPEAVSAERKHGNPRRDWARPAASAAAVSARAAAEAIERVFGQIGKPGPRNGVSVLRGVEKEPMQSLMLAVTLMSVEALGSLANATGKALNIMAQGQRAVEQHEVQEIRDQIDKAIEQQKKAKKAGIFSAICDWVVSAVEVVSGAARVVTGALTGDAMMVAGGAMDLAAGTAGLVKAACETIALIDTKDAAKFKAIAETAGKIQLACEIVGAIVDITSAAQNMLVTKVIPKAAEKVLEEGAGRVVATAVKDGSKEALEAAAKQLGKEVVKSVSEEALDVLGKDVVEKIIQDAVKTAAKNALERGGDIVAEKLAKDIVKQIRRSLIKAIVKAAVVTTVNVTRGALSGANEVFSGVIQIERARLQKQIDQLILDQEMLQALFDDFDRAKKDTEEKMKDLIHAQGRALAGGSAEMRATATVAIRGAASMAGIAAATV
ncbi:pathogenicity island 2 effector protein SseC [Trinickia caryophylli]|nr:pathogenicity island 2 effector protein SseC [Trinickia caryophylli]